MSRCKTEVTNKFKNDIIKTCCNWYNRFMIENKECI